MLKDFLARFKKRLPESKRVLLVIIFVVLFFLLMDLNHRLGEMNRLSQQRATLALETTRLAQTQMVLETKIANVNSDTAVEKWAREEAKLVKPGDKLIVPIPPPGETPQPTPVTFAVPEPVPNWRVWWQLFFGD